MGNLKQLVGTVVRLVVGGSFLSTMAFVAPLFAQCIPPPANLTGWWRGDGTSADVIGSHNATLQNGATYGTGEVGQAFQLDGVDDFVDVPADPALDVGTGDFTVDFWVNFNGTDGEQVMVEKWVQGNTTLGWTFTMQGGGALLLASQGQGGGESDTVASGLSIPTGTWMHLAARRHSGNLAIFMNGSQIASGSNSDDLTNASSLKFGHRGSPSDTPGSTDPRGFFLNGEIDEVQCSSAAPSPMQKFNPSMPPAVPASAATRAATTYLSRVRPATTATSSTGTVATRTARRPVVGTAS